MEVRILFDQRSQPLWQQGSVLPDVALIHLVEHRVCRIRVRVVHAHFVACRRLHAPRPGRNGACGVASALGTQRGQILAQAHSLHVVDLGLSLAGAGRQQQNSEFSVHLFAPCSAAGAADDGSDPQAERSLRRWESCLPGIFGYWIVPGPLGRGSAGCNGDAYFYRSVDALEL